MIWDAERTGGPDFSRGSRIRIDDGGLFELHFNFVHSLIAAIIDVDVDKKHVAADPGLPIKACSEYNRAMGARQMELFARL